MHFRSTALSTFRHFRPSMVTGIINKNPGLMTGGTMARWIAPVTRPMKEVLTKTCRNQRNQGHIAGLRGLLPWRGGIPWFSKMSPACFRSAFDERPDQWSDAIVNNKRLRSKPTGAGTASPAPSLICLPAPGGVPGFDVRPPKPWRPRPQPIKPRLILPAIVSAWARWRSPRSGSRLRWDADNRA